MDREGAKMRLDGGHRGLNRSSTAPITTIEHRGTNDMKPLERPSVERSKKIKEQDESMESDGMVGNVHLASGEKNQSDEQLDQSMDKQNNLTVEEAKDEIRRPSADTGSETTRVESDAHDWAAVRKQAETVDGGGPLGLSAKA
jgi:hypothetical protein